MNKRAFTIVEILITTAIIMLMALVSMPAFSNYRRNANWLEKIEEVESLLNQVDVMAKNPRPNVDGYRVKISESRSNTIEIAEMTNNWADTKVIRTVQLAEGQVINNPLVTGGSGNFQLRSCIGAGACTWNWDTDYSTLQFERALPPKAMSWSGGNPTVLDSSFKIIFVEIQDNNFSPAKKIHLRLDTSPFRITEINL